MGSGTQTEMKREPLIVKVYDLINKRKKIQQKEIYKKFPKEPKSNIRRALSMLKKEGVIFPIKEWRIK